MQWPFNAVRIDFHRGTQRRGVMAKSQKCTDCYCSRRPIRIFSGLVVDEDDICFASRFLLFQPSFLWNHASYVCQNLREYWWGRWNDVSDVTLDADAGITFLVSLTLG